VKGFHYCTVVSDSQNDRVYTARDMPKEQIAAKWLRTRNTFSQSRTRRT